MVKKQEYNPQLVKRMKKRLMMTTQKSNKIGEGLTPTTNLGAKYGVPNRNHF